MPFIPHRDEGLLRVTTRVGSAQRQKPTFSTVGGPEGIRTPDLLNAIETRSQLRHRPLRDAVVVLRVGIYSTGRLPTRTAHYRRLPGAGYSVHQHCSQASSVIWREPRTNRLTL